MEKLLVLQALPLLYTGKMLVSLPPKLPPQFDFDKKNISQLVAAARSLGLLNGIIKSFPGPDILLDTLIYQEAKDSNAVENILTTHKEMYQAKADARFANKATKEVQNYADAVKHGFKLISENNLLTINNIKAIQGINCPGKNNIRSMPGTYVKNTRTDEIVHIPPQTKKDIEDCLSDLEEFINDPSVSELDPLIKLALIHYQFEVIHPFYDGNGRMGRILNVLYLCQQGLLDLPVLYLSRYIIEYKDEYYKLLKQVTEEGSWEEWCIWMLKGIEITAEQTLAKIEKIKKLMDKYEQEIKGSCKFYSLDLINLLFRHPYIAVHDIAEGLNCHAHTARKYLNELAEKNFLEKKMKGKNLLYFNRPLFEILKEQD